MLKEKTIEQRYQKKSQIEHILLRPDTYIGSINQDTQILWVWDDENEKMVQRQISYVPGFYKIFDEILVNAADVKSRQVDAGKSSSRGKMMSTIKVVIEGNTMSVWNDGEGIPVEIHKEHKVWVPELIFGHLLTSDNYDDSEERVTGGRNGFGAKLTNIFSTKFVVECGDSKRKRKFKMTWKKNMSEKSDPEVEEDWEGSADFVKITFTPDFSKFGMTSLDGDILSLLKKRVVDVAGTCSLNVRLNGKKIPISDFKSYVDLYFSNTNSTISDDGSTTTSREVVKIHEKLYRWEVVVSMSDGQFQQVSFVNSICTPRGGQHVTHVTDPLIAALMKKVQAKNKGGMEIKSHQVKNHLFVFINCMIVNPTFDSQSKETMILRPAHFGSKCDLSDKTINAVAKSPILDSVLLWAQTKQQVELARKLKSGPSTKNRERIIGIPKLEDANCAGTNKSERCTLILTEGESAKTSCLAGMSVVGRDYYGILPLRGKVLNVRDAPFKKIVDCKELQEILKVMGLHVGEKDRANAKGLRYGSVMIMTDQDLDGSHIKGLLINLIEYYWPNLFRLGGFLTEFVTPIVKARKGQREEAFFTLREYEIWKEANNGGKGWIVKYYKGLGTSSDREFKQYFTELEQHQIKFERWDDEDHKAVDKAFNPTKAEDRKRWIMDCQQEDFVDHSASKLRYKDFIDKELVHFSKYDLERSVPSMLDGFKPGQRKVLFACLKRKLTTDAKVAQFAGYVAEHSCYHHGETSLMDTIVKMAQRFVGSNNLNILDPIGQFGSRKEGGKDASAPRYIYTKLANVTRRLFHEDDDALLDYKNEEGTIIEPTTYFPIIPLALINGCEGIGTGWSSSVPSFNPRDVVGNMRKYLDQEPMEPMIPFYYGFNGKIERGDARGFVSKGIIRKLDEETVQVTELPVKFWTQAYKEFLEALIDDGTDDVEVEVPKAKAKGKSKAKAKAAPGTNKATKAKKAGIRIIDYRDNSTSDSVNFTIKMDKESLRRAEEEGLEDVFLLKKPISTSNLTLFDSNGKIRTYENELEILNEFANHRLKNYGLRKKYLLAKLEKDRSVLRNKGKFVEEIITEKLEINRKKRSVIVDELSKRNYTPMSVIVQILADWNKPVGEADIAQEEVIEDPTEKKAKDFDYLVGMPLWSLTEERVQDLKDQIESIEAKWRKLQDTTIEDLWKEDLDQLEAAMDERDDMLQEERKEEMTFKAKRRESIREWKTSKKSQTKGKSTTSKSTASKAKSSPVRKSADDESDSIFSDSGDDDGSGTPSFPKSAHPGNSRQSPTKAKAKPKAKSRAKAKPTDETTASSGASVQASNEAPSAPSAPNLSSKKPKDEPPAATAPHGSTLTLIQRLQMKARAEREGGGSTTASQPTVSNPPPKPRMLLDSDDEPIGSRREPKRKAVDLSSPRGPGKRLRNSSDSAPSSSSPPMPQSKPQAAGRLKKKGTLFEETEASESEEVDEFDGSDESEEESDDDGSDEDMEIISDSE